jgi:hypothetical protein
MTGDHQKPAKPPVPSDPERPAYDNPVGNKGELADGNNAPKPQRRASVSDAPQGHASDRKLGRKPAR